LKTKSGIRKAPENWTQQVSKKLRLAQHWHIPDIETGITSGPYHTGRASTRRLVGSLLPVLLTQGASLYSRPTLVTMALQSWTNLYVHFHINNGMFMVWKTKACSANQAFCSSQKLYILCTTWASSTLILLFLETLKISKKNKNHKWLGIYYLWNGILKINQF
jgi:hypothetical protein